MTVPFDAELFGHWWFEGPIFLEHLILAAVENKLPLTTPSEFLAQCEERDNLFPHVDWRRFLSLVIPREVEDSLDILKKRK